MLDSYKRDISYLRISVTDRCNLRCLYCMPPEGIEKSSHNDCLSFEQINDVVKEGVKLGITKVRLTGGEPLVRKGICDLVRLLRSNRELEIIGMTTNGHYLSRYAAELKRAGLSSLNISLDTLNPERYKTLTRGGEIKAVFEGIEAAGAQGFPLKINMVVSSESTDRELQEMERFCRERGIQLQRIREYALNETKYAKEEAVYQRPPPCEACNRIRLLSTGLLKPCLHSNNEIPVDFASAETIRKCLKRAVLEKPRCGAECTGRNMVEIGG